jgi:hypothetical protein
MQFAVHTLGQLAVDQCVIPQSVVVLFDVGDVLHVCVHLLHELLCAIPFRL